MIMVGRILCKIRGWERRWGGDDSGTRLQMRTTIYGGSSSCTLQASQINNEIYQCDLNFGGVLEAERSRNSLAKLYTRWVNGASGVDDISTPRICTPFVQRLTSWLRTLKLDLHMTMCVPYGRRGRQ
jgi:hypothetical protein